MRRPIQSYLIFGVVLLISISGLNRLSFATDVLEILPDGIPEVEALQVFREYFDDDHRVILLLKHDDEIFEERGGTKKMTTIHNYNVEYKFWSSSLKFIPLSSRRRRRRLPPLSPLPRESANSKTHRRRQRRRTTSPRTRF